MKITIITPSYNQAHFLPKTIESVISQEGNFEIEYIIADGGSTDNSVEIIKKYDRLIKDKIYPIKCNNITYVWLSRKDKGQAAAINQGILKASGDIIAYLNSDDVYCAGTFEKVVEAFQTNRKRVWLTGYCRIIDEKGITIQKLITYYKNLWLRHYSYNKLCTTNFIAQPATFWRPLIHKKAGYFDEGLYYTFDYDFWLRTGKKFDPIVIKNYLANFRIHSQSKGCQGYERQFDDDLDIINRYSHNKYTRALHWLNNTLIKVVYKIIK